MLKKNKPAALLTAQSPAAMADACAGLAAEFAAAAKAANVNCIMVTAAAPDEGTAAAAANLAAALGETGARVVLLDCDLRCGMVQKCLDASAPEEKCLASVLAASGEVKPAAVRQNGFYFVPAGEPAKNPAVLLASQRMQGLLEDLREHFDYVICAAPPVGAAADAAVLGRLCDGAVLVVRQRATSRRVVADAACRLEKAGIRLLGTVLTGYDLTLARKMGRPYMGYGVTAK